MRQENIAAHRAGGAVSGGRRGVAAADGAERGGKRRGKFVGGFSGGLVCGGVCGGGFGDGVGVSAFGGGAETVVLSSGGAVLVELSGFVRRGDAVPPAVFDMSVRDGGADFF